MTQEATPLRFHHLKHLKNLLLKGASQYEIELTADLQALKKNAAINFLDTFYYQDTVGSQVNESGYIAASLSALNSYLQLEDDSAVKLIASDKDLICKVCVEGKHCNQEAGYREEADITYQLLRAKQKHNIQGPYLESGSKLLQTYQVITTMGVIRSILTAESGIFA